jgi:hypothetical protein
LRLRQAQADLIDLVSGIHTSPTFHVLAIAILSQTAEHVVQDALFVPDLLRLETVRDMVEAAVARRVTTWCAISGGACWPGGLAGVGYRSAARSETRTAMAV